MAERPTFVVAIAGTATEIGKTYVGAQLNRQLVADGWVTAPRKPAQSFEPGDEGDTDADQLARSAGVTAHEVCPAHRWYETPMAPPMAARALGRPPVTMAELMAELEASWPQRRADVGFVELAGGVASPLAEPDPGGDDGAAFLRAVQPDLTVLVADAGLGTINAVRLSLAPLEGAPVVVYLNRYEESTELHRLNRAWLDADGFEVLVDPVDLATRIAEAVPTFCGYTGRPSTESTGGVPPLEPERFCRRCGRRLVVQVAPTSVTSRCKVHG